MRALSETTGLQAPVIGGAIVCIGLWYWASKRKDATVTGLEGEPKPNRAPG